MKRKGYRFIQRVRISFQKIKRRRNPKIEIKNVTRTQGERRIGPEVLSSGPIDWEFFEKRQEGYVEIFEALGWMDLLRTREHIYDKLVQEFYQTM